MNYHLYNTKTILLKEQNFRGWGRKRSGRFASYCQKKFGGTITLLEDGFIRSLGLGVNGSPSFSLVEDDIGIYYDATTPSKLENILNEYDFKSDEALEALAKEAMTYMREYHISKYNDAPNISDDYFKDESKERVLIVAQTNGDSSLEYGLGDKFSTKEMIADAFRENPNASVYLKIHPDVLSGKKASDISSDEIPKACKIIDENINPISLLKHFKKVYTKTSGMGMEALILGLDVLCYGMPFYAGWGLTIDKQVCKRRTRTLTLEELFVGAYILYTKYYNPYAKKESDIMDTMRTINRYRTLKGEHQGALYFFGFLPWKRKNIKLFFPLERDKIFFCDTLEEAKKKGLNGDVKIYIWGKKAFDEVETYAKEKEIIIHRVEDGFVRSVSLGSDLSKAYSLVVDTRGIYFDATQESDLEHILNTYDFDEKFIVRSQKLQNYLVEKKISKYNASQDKKITLKRLKEGQSVVLVVGQVEDDASIVYGARGMTNLQLLKEARENAPDAYIIYKPHPDVLAGNRVGNITQEIALNYCDEIIVDASLDSVLELVDEVHIMTSLVGFEALIRGKKVTTYGLPFYAGWGLTTDKRKCERRVRERSLDELVAGTFFIYSKYIDPKTDQIGEIEVLLEEIEKQKYYYNNRLAYRVSIKIKNFLLRKKEAVKRALNFTG